MNSAAERARERARVGVLRGRDVCASLGVGDSALAPFPPRELRRRARCFGGHNFAPCGQRGGVRGGSGAAVVRGAHAAVLMNVCVW